MLNLCEPVKKTDASFLAEKRGDVGDVCSNAVEGTTGAATSLCAHLQQVELTCLTPYNCDPETGEQVGSTKPPWWR